MSSQGTLISRELVAHVCCPWNRYTPIAENDILYSTGARRRIHDDSHLYHHGDVLECNECHRRWTLNFPGPIEGGQRWRGRWYGFCRLMASAEDWVPEPTRKWKRRMKKQAKHG